MRQVFQTLIFIVGLNFLNCQNLTVTTQIGNQNFTVIENYTVNRLFQKKLIQDNTCHPTPQFMENYDVKERIFYIKNEEEDNLTTKLDNNIIFIQNKSEINCTFNYPPCQNSWEKVQIAFNEIKIEYIKLCEPISAPLHPILLLLLSAIILVYVGSVYGQTSMTFLGETHSEDVGMFAAIGFIFFGSGMLILLYFLHEYLEKIMLIWVLAIGYVAIYKLLCDIFEYLRFMGRKGFTIMKLGFYSDRQILSGIIALSLVLIYFFTKQWIISNFIAISITLLMFKIIEINSLKVSTVLLSLAFIYDIFWVFYSSFFFGESVMATVATSIDLPMKLQCPVLIGSFPKTRCSILGLGDIILPGILIKYLYKQNRQIFMIGYFGYILGLITCVLFLIVYELAQPALLYLVPSIIIPVLISSHRKGILFKLWSGQQMNTKKERIEQIDQDYELAAGEI